MTLDPRQSSSSTSADGPPLYEESSSSLNTTDRPPAYESLFLPRPKPNNKLDPRETLLTGIEEFNQARGPQDKEISLEYWRCKFDPPEAGARHKKEKKEWQEWVNLVNEWIKHLTALNDEGKELRRHLVSILINSPFSFISRRDYQGF
jgi:hypothetical protein